MRRKEFLQNAASQSAAVSLGPLVAAPLAAVSSGGRRLASARPDTPDAQTEDPSQGSNMSEPSMPQVPFGPHAISRLIVGGNPINAGSHLSRFVNHQMREYFTPDRVMRLLMDCQREDVNAWQSVPANLDLYARHRQEGGRLQYIALAKDDPDDPGQLARLVAAGTMAIAHHGEVTDKLFKQGQLDTIRRFLDGARAAGALAGVSTHMPAVLDHVESQGWDVDFYMTCAYERHRTREELKALLGHVPIPLREVYLEEDPPRMFKAMRQTTRPCLAFKILAAGRLCDKQEAVEKAFRETFRQIKPNDAVIVGMYPEFEDQAKLNADYVRRFSALSASS